MSKEQQARFHFIEVFAKWLGRVNASHIMAYFDLSRQAASRTITQYMAKYPENLIYNESLKGFLPTSQFSAKTSVGAFSEYQQITRVNQSKYLASIEHIELPNREPEPKLVQPILRAINEKLAIDIGYLSLSNPHYLDRIIEPHSLVFDGLRYHVRAFCHKNNDYRDFVLSRFNGELNDEFKATHGAQDDRLWHTQLEVVIMADSRLSPAQKRVIELDYQMKNGTSTIKTTAALVQYTLKRLHLDAYQTQAEAQQIILTPECLRAISPYLPKPA
ncbi:WYL domain-containing protein [Pseudoalteromonas denitrificans]|uniref:WYL domain-containing protein n=1 Tax=Pseudoalteromonas denitrificans DSM 6059 TaxID=1123010 RepID=A0A1I1U042_9GAMM|nr:WYL domain-containing protein [Pseudoalteromonas denitrificans]SFD62063.1 WYL domain-containing protein [Pseudoalteromonas denitrificans DSM 6059]